MGREASDGSEVVGGGGKRLEGWSRCWLRLGSRVCSTLRGWGCRRRFCSRNHRGFRWRSLRMLFRGWGRMEMGAEVGAGVGRGGTADEAAVSVYGAGGAGVVEGPGAVPAFAWGSRVGEDDGEEEEDGEEGRRRRKRGMRKRRKKATKGVKNPLAARQAPCPAWATLCPRATPSSSGGPHVGLAPGCPPLRHPYRTRTRTLCPIPGLCCHTRRKAQAIASRQTLSP